MRLAGIAVFTVLLIISFLFYNKQWEAYEQWKVWTKIISSVVPNWIDATELRLERAGARNTLFSAF